MSFVFYDTETTGTSNAFDQILQFAAIHTDADFKELDRFEIRCRLLPHIVPAPKAMEVTGVTVEQLVDASLPSHYEMVRTIRKKFLEWSPAIYIGHNSVDFDENFMRQAFYQTLHPLYLTHTGGNHRADTLCIVQATSLFAPEALIFPTDDKNKKTFKLDRLAPANGFNHSHAHDAMCDVEATIHICRILKERASEVWTAAMRFNQKANVIDYVSNELVFSFSDYYYGKPYSTIVTGLGANPSNISDLFLFDLAIDPATFAGLSDEQLTKEISKSPKPIRRIRANSCPILMPAKNAPPIAQAIALGSEELRRRAQFLKSDLYLCNKLINAYLSTKEEAKVSEHVEEQIYGSFPSKNDEKRMANFHNLPWEERLAVVEQFEDPRWKILAYRLIFFERPDLLDTTKQAEHKKHFASRIVSDRSETPWRTLQAAIQEIDALIITVDKSKVALLQGHRDYLVEWIGHTLPIANV